MIVYAIGPVRSFVDVVVVVERDVNEVSLCVRYVFLLIEFLGDLR